MTLKDCTKAELLWIIEMCIRDRRSLADELPLRTKEKQLPEGAEAPDRPEPGHSGSAEARTDGSMFPQVGTVPDSVLSRRGPHLHLSLIHI